MKKAFLSIMLILSIFTYGQAPQGRLLVTDSLQIGLNRVGAVSKDVTLSSNSDRKLVSEKAVKGYVDARQLEFINALAAKQNAIATGSTTQYIKGDGSLGTFPTDLSFFANSPNYLTYVTGDARYLTPAAAASTYLTSATAASTYLTSATAASTYQPLTANITTQGNTFNGASQLVKLGADGKYPALDGSLITNLPTGGASVAGSNTQVQFNNSGALGASSGFIFNPTTQVLGVNNVRGLVTGATLYLDADVDGNGGTGAIQMRAGAVYLPGATATSSLFNAGGSFNAGSIGSGLGYKVMNRTIFTPHDNSTLRFMDNDEFTKMGTYIQNWQINDVDKTNLMTFKPSVLFELSSVTRGFLLPRLTTTQRDAISSPATGLQVFNTTLNTLDYFNGGTWLSMSGGNASTSNTNYGVNTMSSVTTAAGGAAFGYNALNKVTTGFSNSAFGSNSSANVTTGVGNVSMGNFSMANLTTGAQNVSVGSGSLINTVSGSGNVAIGADALQNNTTGNNIGIGVGGAKGITSGQYNTGIGVNVMQAAMTGAYNTGIGVNTLTATTSGDQNSAFGLNSLQSNTTGTSNTAVGRALQNNTSGGNNVGLGWQAGNNNTTASNQIFINSLARSTYSADQTESPIYVQQDATVSNQIVTLNGRVGINTISPATTAALDVNSTTKGFMAPRMTTTQRDLIASPAEGLEIYNLTVHAKEFFNGTVWKTVTTN